MAKKIKKPQAKASRVKKKPLAKAGKKAAPKTSKKVSAKGSKKTSKKKAKGKKELMCFLTTACVRYFGLPDNCEQLTILRNYRDTYLGASDEGRELVEEYYRIAPVLVRKINKDSKRAGIYTYIYDVIRRSCDFIGLNDYQGAEKAYRAMVHNLSARYN
jgi:hypothetical protein